MAWQPVIRLADRRVAGWEALIRHPSAAPPELFRQAARDGQELALDAACLRAVFAGPHPPDGLLFVNLSPATVAALATGTLHLRCPPGLARRVVWELPEAGGWPHDPASIRAIRSALPPGSRVALDDVGAGSADLTRLAALKPDYAKLARALVTGLDGDPARQAVVRAVAGAASQMGVAVIAEGVEREEEARCLAALGVAYAQGFLFGAPAPLEVACGAAPDPR